MTISIEQSQVHGFEFLELINLIPYPAPKLNQENLVLVPPKLWFCYWTIEVRPVGASFLLCLLLLLWEHIPLLQPIAFKIPAHLGVVSYTVCAAVKQALTLLLLALTSSC